MSLKRRFLKGFVENHVARWLGDLLWPPVSVAVLAHGENDDILTIKSSGSHELPGGILENHEDLHEAARREVKEETGFDVEVGKLLDIRIPEGGLGGVHFFFEAEVSDGEKSGSWEGEPEFVPKEEVEEREWKLHHSHIHEYLFPGG
ncbi:MAG: NUDIX hydrolase [Candidatus Nanohaloarchaea archaeon]